MTYRERREARAEKLQEWAGKREQKAEALTEQNAPYVGDWAFITQPGRIPERDRANRRDEKAYEHQVKAKEMAGKAATIQRQLDQAIYDDDPDAVEALEERIATLEAKRETIKAEMAAFRKANKELLKGKTAYEKAQLMPHADYELPYLTANIARNKKRLVTAKARRERTAAVEEAPGGVIVRIRRGYAEVTFAEKPEREILVALKAAGFYWGGGRWLGEEAKLPKVIEEIPDVVFQRPENQLEGV